MTYSKINCIHSLTMSLLAPVSQAPGDLRSRDPPVAFCWNHNRLVNSGRVGSSARDHDGCGGICRVLFSSGACHTVWHSKYLKKVRRRHRLQVTGLGSKSSFPGGLGPTPSNLHAALGDKCISDDHGHGQTSAKIAKKDIAAEVAGKRREQQPDR